MKTRQIGTAAATLAAMACALTACSSLAQRPKSPTAEELAAKGRESAVDFPGLGTLCDLEMPLRDVNAPRPEGRPGRGQGRGEGRPRGSRPGGGERPAAPPPMQVFDNLYFVGTAAVSAWIVGDKDGYILIDALTNDEASREQIAGGMRTLGLDPAKIKYLLITHAHGDHFGGWKYLSQTYPLKIVMSDADWQMASTLAPHPRFGLPPARDVSVKDGDKLTAGKTTIEIHVTPGHTPGTISPIFTVYDKGVAHKAALWGGTGFNFGPDEQQLRVYARSAEAYKKLAGSEGVDVFLSNHANRDGSLEKMEQLAARASGAPNPFILGKKSLVAFDVLKECALAQAERVRADGTAP